VCIIKLELKIGLLGLALTVGRSKQSVERMYDILYSLCTPISVPPQIPAQMSHRALPFITVDDSGEFQVDMVRRAIGR
jgi:hypothetical protein